MSKKPVLWLFDLDNTLHNASRAIFPEINRNMNDYMHRELVRQGHTLDAGQINALRQQYWQQYGATLLGMMRHHEVPADEFLAAAHALTDLVGMIHAERGLANMLRRLPGKKVILTNAPRAYSRDVVRHLGLERLFDGHIAVEDMYVHGHLCPKPSRRMLRKLLVKLRCAPSRAILVEDTVLNLKAAKRVGLRTALVTGYHAENAPMQMERRTRAARKAAFIDVKVRSARHLVRHIARLR